VAAHSAIDRRDQKKLDAEQRQRISALKKPIEARLKRVEEKIAKRNAQMSEIDAKLGDTSIYDNPRKAELKTVLTDQTFYKKDLEQLEAEWLKEQEALEQIGG
jgi:ATP-binding cassette subfamily F protein 3